MSAKRPASPSTAEPLVKRSRWEQPDAPNPIYLAKKVLDFGYAIHAHWGLPRGILDDGSDSDDVPPCVSAAEKLLYNSGGPVSNNVSKQVTLDEPFDVVIGPAEALLLTLSSHEPASDELVDRLLALDVVTPSGYGDLAGERTAHDTSVRMSHEVRAPNVSLLRTDELMNALLKGVREVWDLGRDEVAIEAFKLVIYPPGGHFAEHTDTPDDNFLGSAVVLLPSARPSAALVLIDGRAGKEGSGWQLPQLPQRVKHTVKPQTERPVAVVFAGFVPHYVPPTESARMALTFKVRRAGAPETPVVLPQAPPPNLMCDEPTAVLAHLHAAYTPADLQHERVWGDDARLLQIARRIDPHAALVSVYCEHHVASEHRSPCHGCAHRAAGRAGRLWGAAARRLCVGAATRYARRRARRLALRRRRGRLGGRAHTASSSRDRGRRGPLGACRLALGGGACARRRARRLRRAAERARRADALPGVRR